MTNKTVGKIGAAVTGLAVLSFAVSMIIGLFYDTIFASCFSSMFIALGFLPLMGGLYSVDDEKDKKAAGLAGLMFAAAYCVLICIVYFAQCTTININKILGEEVLSIISYSHQGSLFFNYDLLGYAFMALATFFMGSRITAASKSEKWLKALLMIHGIFFITCLFIPMFPVFTSSSSPVFGTIILEFWCAYFLPVCVLSYIYFSKK